MGRGESWGGADECTSFDGFAARAGGRAWVRWHLFLGVHVRFPDGQCMRQPRGACRRAARGCGCTGGARRKARPFERPFGATADPATGAHPQLSRVRLRRPARACGQLQLPAASELGQVWGNLDERLHRLVCQLRRTARGVPAAAGTTTTLLRAGHMGR